MIFFQIVIHSGRNLVVRLLLEKKHVSIALFNGTESRSRGTLFYAKMLSKF